MTTVTIPIEWFAEILLELPTGHVLGQTKCIDGNELEPRWLECRTISITLGELLKRIDPDEKYFHIEPSQISPTSCIVWSPRWWRVSYERHLKQRQFSEAERQERAFYAEQQAGLFNAIATRMSLDQKKDRELLHALCSKMLTMIQETPELAKQLCLQVYGFELRDYVKSNKE